MKKLYLLLGCLLSLDALAYSAAELREDCQAADTTIVQNKPADPQHALRVARCTYYLSGFADGYTVGDYLADKVGVQLNAFCVPRTPDRTSRLVRVLLAHFDHLPPNIDTPTATVVAAALSKAFPCGDETAKK